MTDINDLVRANIRSLIPYSSARDEFRKQGVFLDANENPYGNCNRYPDPNQLQLKQRISELKQIKEENIFVGNGSDEILDLLFRVFCHPGVDKAINFPPTYGMYKVLSALNDIELVSVPLTKEHQLDIDNIVPELTRSIHKLMLICSPNNPTGNLFKHSAIEQLLTCFNGIVVIDEAYIDFAESSSWIRAISNYSNLVVIQTLSKAWGLAGARIGIAYANTSIIDLLNKVKAPYNVSELNQQKAIEVLGNTKTYEDNLELILKEKRRLEKDLKQLPIVSKVFSSDTNFLLVEVCDADKIYHQLLNKQLVVRNRSKQINNCLRITIGTPKENQLLLRELENIAV